MVWSQYNETQQRYILVSGHKYENVWVKMGDEKNWESAKQKLPVMEIGRNLNFDHYVRKREEN